MADLGFWALAQDDPDFLALVTPDGEEVTSGQLLAHANQVVHALRAQGVTEGDVVATLLPNCAEMIEVYLAALQAGWRLVPINHHLVAPEIAYILKDSGAKVFISHTRFADASVASADEAAIPEIGRLSVGHVDGFASYTATRDSHPSTLPGERTVGDVMNYTSGTTGNPKGIYRKLLGVSPEDAALGLAGLLFLFSIQPQDDNVHIIGSPLYHTAVLRFGSASLHMGHTVVLMDKWIPEEMLRLIEQHRVTTSHMVPTQFHRLLALPEDVRGKYDMSSLRHMIHAAAPCPIDVKHKMIDWGGDAVGDGGLIDEEGYLFLRDRKIDMIISGGANIYPAEIEGVLLSHPKVGDAAVFGIPHEDWGEEVKAVIEPAEGIAADDVLAREILEFCAGKLAKFKTPPRMDFTNEMPRDPNGKLYKRKLRDPYWEGVQRSL